MHGGKRENAGRPRGARNRATQRAKATISELARAHGPAVVDVLVKIATTGESETARIAAACALLDRGYGKPRQALDVDVQGAPLIGHVTVYLPHNNREPAPIEGRVVPIGVETGSKRAARADEG